MGLDPEGYGNPDFCWISIYDKLLWSFAGPIAIVILVIIICLINRVALLLKLFLKNLPYFFNPNEPQGVIYMIIFPFMFLCPDEWGDFHGCSQDFLQSLSEGDQETPRYVSTSC